MAKKKKHLVQRMPLESLLKINAEALSFCKCPHLKSLSLWGVVPQRRYVVWEGEVDVFLDGAECTHGYLLIRALITSLPT